VCSIFSTQESFWRCLEGEVISEGQNFNGKIEIPSTLHYLLPKLDEEEVKALGFLCPGHIFLLLNFGNFF